MEKEHCLQKYRLYYLSTAPHPAESEDASQLNMNIHSAATSLFIYLFIAYLTIPYLSSYSVEW
jgi:hypothetical protein